MESCSKPWKGGAALVGGGHIFSTLLFVYKGKGKKNLHQNRRKGLKTVFFGVRNFNKFRPARRRALYAKGKKSQRWDGGREMIDMLNIYPWAEKDLSMNSC